MVHQTRAPALGSPYATAKPSFTRLSLFGPWRLVSHCRWIWYNDGRPLNRSAPINITLWGRSGAVRRASLMDLAEDQYDLGVQF